MYTISDEAADEDLPKQFEIVIARLNEKTGWNLNAKNTASIDQVILKITAVGKDEDPEKHEKAKKIWKTTMMCVDRLGVFVQRFGAFAAQAASVVFGPANQCFNAINFVISAAQQYKEVFAKVTVLMERVSVFLENLDTFMNDRADVKLDKRLRKTCYRVLEHFVKIMSTTYDLTNSKRARLKLMATSFAFGEDAGVSGSLATLETLVSDFTGAQISVLVSNLSAAAQDIRVVDQKLDNLGEAVEKQTSFLGQLATADASRSQEEREKKELEIIKKALGIDESKVAWDRQGELWDNRITGTGQWLLNKPYLSKWADKAATASEIIMMNAPSGHGKSHLASIVVRHLQDKHRGDTRVVVAYFYRQRDERSSTLNKIVKTIIWQLARTNREYTKAAARACEGGIDTSRTSIMWKKLITDIAKSVEATLFVVLDGLDELDQQNDIPDVIDVIKQVRSISDDQTSHLKVRAFITGIHEALDQINEKIEPAVLELNLEADADSDKPAMNQSDLELYVGDRLDRVDRLNGLDDPLKERVRKELATGARGDYSRLLYLLDDLVNVQNTNQIDDILDRANQSLSEIIANKVTSLNNSLSSDEISEVNTLLDWVSVSYTNLIVAQCEAVLSLKADSQSLGLEDRIRNKYFELFSVNDDKEITIRAGVEEYLKESSESTTVPTETTRRAASALQAPEIALVQKILSTHFRNVFGDEDVYARFGFETFFQDKLGDQALRIRLVESESHIRVAQGCVIAVCDKYADERSKDLLGYAYNWFVDHLEDVQIDETEPVVKQDMGRKLTRMLQEEVLIEGWWAPERMHLTDFHVFNDSSKELLLLLHNFLKDSSVQKGLTDMPTERKWVARMTAEDQPDFNMYENIAKVMAKRWFQSKEFDEATKDAFDWLVGWMQCLNGETPKRDEPPTVDLIQQIAAWAKTSLGNGDEAGKWHGTLAAAYWSYDFYDEAVIEYRHAIELRPTAWTLRMGLAECFGFQENYNDAILALEELIGQRADLIGSDEQFTTMYWDRLLHDIAQWKLALKDYTAAEGLYQRLLDHGMEQQELADAANEAILGMLRVLNKQERHSAAVALLDQWCNRRDTENVNWTGKLFRSNCVEDDFHHCLFVAAKRSGMRDAVLQRYEQAIEAMEAESTNDLVRISSASLRFHLAHLLWTGSREQQHCALDIWEQIVYHDPYTKYAAYAGSLQRLSSKKLASGLVCEMKRLWSDSKSEAKTLDHFTRLQRLTEFKIDSAFVTNDPRLMLARMYQLSGESARAQDLVRSFLKDAFDMALTDAHGYYYVGVVLQAIDDDVNALAAWSSCLPVDPTESEDLKDEPSEGNGLTDVVAVDQAIAGAASEANHSKETNGVVDPVVSAEEDASATPGQKLKEAVTVQLKGTLVNRCDGGCGVSWTYADNFYSCKDCLDVQLDPVCYEKLKNDELDVAICGHDHEHIHIPPFDEKAWRSMPKDHISVAGVVMPRYQWVDSVRKDWQIDDASLKVSDDAARKIQKAWKAHRFQQPSKWDGVLAGTGIVRAQAA